VIARLQHRLADHQLTYQGRSFQSTLTAGIVLFDPHSDAAMPLDALLQRADEALYAAKQRGGNAIALAPASAASAPT